MWDNLLKKLKQDTVNQAIQCWHGNLNSLTLISEGINTVYQFKTKDETFYLRVTHEKLRPYVALEAAISFQEHLFQSGIPVCEPVLSINQSYIEKIMQGSDAFLMHVCKEVPGAPMHVDYKSSNLYHHWGACLARFHKASKAFQPKHAYGKWENDIEELKGYLNKESDDICERLNTLLKYFSQHPQLPSNFGLIHGDHRKGNVLSDGSKISFIDFDLPRYCWFMDDISRPFFSSIGFGDNNWQDKLLPYLSGYHSVESIREEDLAAFPWFLHYKAMNIYLWTKHNWEGEIAPGGIKTTIWLDKLYNMTVNESWKNALDNMLSNIKGQVIQGQGS